VGKTRHKGQGNKRLKKEGTTDRALNGTFLEREKKTGGKKKKGKRRVGKMKEKGGWFREKRGGKKSTGLTGKKKWNKAGDATSASAVEKGKKRGTRSKTGTAGGGDSHTKLLNGKN